MKVIQSITELKAVISEIKKSNKSIGFVPTMGYLHEGHLQLVQHAKQETDITVVSIFVNPLQFGPNEDFETYPRDLNRDQELLQEKEIDILFYPSVQEMYPQPLTSTLIVNKRTNVLCGKSRPGHFDGVVTVLTKLFHLVQPINVYMGSKDAQQVAVVMGMVEDLNFPTTIIPVPTVREEDGLAKSSRNIFLTETERLEANHLYKALLLGKQLFNNSMDVEDISTQMKVYLEEHTSGKLDYLEVLAYPSLTNVEATTEKVIIALAMKYSKARLIDNIIFTLNMMGEEN